MSEQFRREMRRRLPAPVVRVIKAVLALLRAVPRTRSQWRAFGQRLVERRVIGTGPGRRAVRAAWRLRTALPHDEAALKQRVHVWGHRFARSGHAFDAIELYAAVEPKLTDPDLRAALLVQRTSLELRRGNIPADLADRTRLLLERADAALGRGDLIAAAARLQEAFNLVYNRTLHFEDQPSLLSADPDAFLAPFRANATFAAVTKPSGGLRPRTPTPGGRPRRVLFVNFMSWQFVNGIIEDYRATPGVDVRVLDLSALPDGPWRAQPVDLVTRRLQASLASDPVVLPDDVRDAFDWADSVFVEWGHRALAWTSLVPDVRARVVARLHSYEAFTPMPLHTDWSRIDDLVFVSPHIRALVEASVPDLAGGPRMHNIANRNVFAQYVRPKLPGSEWTLGMIGFDNLSKDPAWALDVFEQVRRQDPRWRLLLLGRNFPRTNLTRPATLYRDRFEARLADLGDAVDRPGYTEDVPEALRRIGVIVSSSRREGTHEGLLQGTASGAFPLVRNWPYVAKWGGPATLLPGEWVVETPEQAAQRLLEAAANRDEFEKARAEAAEWIVSRYDWSVVRPALDALLLEDAR